MHFPDLIWDGMGALGNERGWERGERGKGKGREERKRKRKGKKKIRNKLGPKKRKKKVQITYGIPSPYRVESPAVPRTF